MALSINLLSRRLAATGLSVRSTGSTVAAAGGGLCPAAAAGPSWQAIAANAAVSASGQNHSNNNVVNGSSSVGSSVRWMSKKSKRKDGDDVVSQLVLVELVS